LCQGAWPHRIVKIVSNCTKGVIWLATVPFGEENFCRAAEIVGTLTDTSMFSLAFFASVTRVGELLNICAYRQPCFVRRKQLLAHFGRGALQSMLYPKAHARGFEDSLLRVLVKKRTQNAQNKFAIIHDNRLRNRATNEYAAPVCVARKLGRAEAGSPFSPCQYERAAAG
jgi:hypothetical protein